MNITIIGTGYVGLDELAQANVEAERLSFTTGVAATVAFGGKVTFTYASNPTTA